MSSIQSYFVPNLVSNYIKMHIKYSTIAMTRNKYLSLNGFRKTLLKANVTVLFLILSHNATISRLNRIGRQLQMVELTAGEIGSELAVPFAFSSLHETSKQHARKSYPRENRYVPKKNFRRITKDISIDHGRPIWGLILWACCDLPINPILVLIECLVTICSIPENLIHPWSVNRVRCFF